MIDRPHTRQENREGAGVPVSCEGCGRVFRLVGDVPETTTCPYCGRQTATIQPRETTDC